MQKILTLKQIRDVPFNGDIRRLLCVAEEVHQDLGEASIERKI